MWESNIKVDVKEKARVAVDWINLALHRTRVKSFIKTLMRKRIT